MSIRVRIVLLVAVTSLLMLFLTSITLSTLIESEFSSIEATQTQNAAERAVRAVQNAEEQLSLHNRDWAKWDDTYQYVVDRNDAYRSANLHVETFVGNNFLHAIFWDANGNYLEGYQLDHDGKRLIEPEESVRKAIISNPALAGFRDDQGSVHGLARLNDGRLLMVTASTIQDSARQSPSRGLLAFTREVDEEFVVQLSTQTQSTLQIYPVSDEELAPEMRKFRDAAVRSEGTYINPLSTSTMSAFRVLSDVAGKPVLLLELTAPRPIYQHSLRLREITLRVLTLGAALSLILSWLGLRAWIVNPLRNLLRQLQRITVQSDAAGQVSTVGSQELDEVARHVNHMLVALRRTHEIENARTVAEQANAAKSNFIAKVSHELRTPIHGILGLVRVIRRKVTDNTAANQLGMIRDAAAGLLAVVNDILDFSRTESGNLTISSEEFSLSAVTRSSLRTVSTRLFERSEGEPLECFAWIDKSLPDLRVGDGRRLSQILVNLLGNAVKFTRSGFIRLEVRRPEGSDSDDWIEIVVEDTGIGIPADKLDSIFEPFRQVDDSVQRAFDGTGLGLAIVKQITEAMRGNIHVESTSGRGSIFRVTLPLKLQDHQSSEATAISHNIWLVDDGLMEASVVAEELETRGARVSLFSTGEISESGPSTIDLSDVDYVAVSGLALSKPSTRTLVQRFITEKGARSVLAWVSPFDLSHREYLRSLGVTKLTMTPLVAQDIPDLLLGTYQEDFGSYDDFIQDLAPAKTRLDILIADDIVANQVVLRCMLEDAGHRVTVVGNGKELIDTIGHRLGLRDRRPDDRTYDVIITDIQMPVMDGASAARIVREREELLKVPEKERAPLVAVTAHALPKQLEELIGCGFDALVTKPIEPKELEDAIERATQHVHPERPANPAHEVTLSNPVALRPPVIATASDLIAFVDILHARVIDAQNDGLGNGKNRYRLLDTVKLAERGKGKLSRCVTLMEAFLTTAHKLRMEFASSVESGDLERVQAVAHSLKGFMGELGCSEGTELATSVTFACRQGSVSLAQREITDAMLLLELLERLLFECLQAAGSAPETIARI